MLNRRTKYSHDPNNTAWSRSSDGYGQRLLQSKGWTPGASLGARNKPYTRTKDASYIRVSMKDDNLGLGAKSGVNAPTTGLDAFQGLLGRLNGKQDDELEKEQRTRDDLRRAVYTENRWGALRFVSGGFLVGDKIEEMAGDKAAARSPEAESMNTRDKIYALDANSTSRTASSKSAREDKSGKKPKKSKKRRESTFEAIQIEDQHSKESMDSDTCHEAPSNVNPEKKSGNVSGDRSENNTSEIRRAEKAQRKMARQVRREEKRFRRLDTAEVKRSGSVTLEVHHPGKEVVPIDLVKSEDSSRTASTGRQHVRSRYVQQKKMALMDPKALNEVCKYQHSCENTL